MASKHSPGPWRTHPHTFDDDVDIVLGVDGGQIARVFESPADARLIAAAPELLEFVREYVKNHPEVPAHGCVEYCPPCRARALLAAVDPCQSISPLAPDGQRSTCDREDGHDGIHNNRARQHAWGRGLIARIEGK